MNIWWGIIELPTCMILFTDNEFDPNEFWLELRTSLFALLK